MCVCRWDILCRRSMFAQSPWSWESEDTPQKLPCTGWAPRGPSRRASGGGLSTGRGSRASLPGQLCPEQRPCWVPLSLLSPPTLLGTEGKGPVSPQCGLGVPLGGGRTHKRPQWTWRHTLGCSGPPSPRGMGADVGLGLPSLWPFLPSEGHLEVTRSGAERACPGPGPSAVCGHRPCGRSEGS